MKTSQIVKPMERGQVTIPIDIRKELEITPETWLWVRIKGKKILIEPVEKSKKSSQDFSLYLRRSAEDKNSYWSKEDDKNLEKLRKKTAERVSRLS